MEQQIRTWRTAENERSWLSMLVGALEQASQSNCDARVYEYAELARLRSRLSCPASPYAFSGSVYSLRN
jgi:hypothetical protein